MLSPQHNRVQLFKSYAGANMIKPVLILVMLCDLSEWCFLKIVQPPLLSSSHCCLTWKESHVLHKSVSNGSILINIRELLALILLLISKRLLNKIPPTRKNLLYRLLNLHQGHHLWNLHEDLGILMVSNQSQKFYSTTSIIIIHTKKAYRLPSNIYTLFNIHG